MENYNEIIKNGGHVCLAIQMNIDMKENFDKIIKYYKENSKYFSYNIETQNEFNNEIENSLNVFNKSKDNLKCFFSITTGMTKLQDMQTMDFPYRFLKKTKINDLSCYSLESIIIDCFLIGFIYHFIFTNFATRNKYETVDYDKLYDTWLPNTLVADIKMRAYNKDHNMAPEKYFLNYYKKEIKNCSSFNFVFKIGVLKRSKVLSYLKNIMFCGLLYGMNYDMATK